ncbi:hypothetical protein IMZ11_31205 [Microtetraspora sp. AC03309]|uniref:hypothetical protein n=1 Tax=Microtetraspora sp. AC03309 TaxID=2779376 RepID=UPI001E2E60CB|nr:hypothetical protein [Microtetraspora sp. AC03309]MCC5580102.1 hypothetical protein [Microtetraspora sp. AC03309]
MTMPEWVNAHGSHLLDYAGGLLGPARAPVVVASVLAACRTQGGPPDGVSPAAWLLGSVRQRCRTDPEYRTGYVPGPGPGVPDLRSVERAWMLADPLGAEALRLMYRHELSVGDVGHVLGLSVEDTGRLATRTQDLIEIMVSAMDALVHGRAVCPELSPLFDVLFPDPPGAPTPAEFADGRMALMTHIVGCAVCKRPINIRYTVPQMTSHPPIPRLTAESRAQLEGSAPSRVDPYGPPSFPGGFAQRPVDIPRPRRPSAFPGMGGSDEPPPAVAPPPRDDPPWTLHTVAGDLGVPLTPLVIPPMDDPAVAGPGTPAGAPGSAAKGPVPPPDRPARARHAAPDDPSLTSADHAASRTDHKGVGTGDDRATGSGGGSGAGDDRVMGPDGDHAAASDGESAEGASTGAPASGGAVSGGAVSGDTVSGGAVWGGDMSATAMDHSDRATAGTAPSGDDTAPPANDGAPTGDDLVPADDARTPAITSGTASGTSGSPPTGGDRELKRDASVAADSVAVDSVAVGDDGGSVGDSLGTDTPAGNSTTLTGDDHLAADGDPASDTDGPTPARDDRGSTENDRDSADAADGTVPEPSDASTAGDGSAEPRASSTGPLPDVPGSQANRSPLTRPSSPEPAAPAETGAGYDTPLYNALRTQAWAREVLARAAETTAATQPIPAVPPAPSGGAPAASNSPPASIPASPPTSRRTARSPKPPKTPLKTPASTAQPPGRPVPPDSSPTSMPVSSAAGASASPLSAPLPSPLPAELTGPLPAELTGPLEERRDRSRGGRLGGGRNRPLSGQPTRPVPVVPKERPIARNTSLKIAVIVLAGAAGTVTGIKILGPALDGEAPTARSLQSAVVETARSDQGTQGVFGDPGDEADQSMGDGPLRIPATVTLDEFGQGTMTLTVSEGAEASVTWRISAPGLVVTPSKGTLKRGGSGVVSVRALRVRYWCGAPEAMTTPLTVHGPAESITTTVRWRTC